MGRKKDHDYFAMLVEGVNYACEAATMLKTTFENFEPEKLQENINKVHHVEHTADMAKHDMMEKLVKEFITPIDREDILELADVIDDVTDDLEEILYDYHLAQAMAENGARDSMDFRRYSYVRAVFDKHGVTEAEFDTS